MTKEKVSDRKIVIINQGVNYLTIGLANAFAKQFTTVELVTGSIHPQGENLEKSVRVTYINKFRERPPIYKILAYSIALLKMYWLLLTRFRKYEVFFVSLPPMAYLLNIFLPNRFSMLIWDVYPDIFKITGMKEKQLFYRLWSGLNKRSFTKAYRLFTISNIMAEALSKYVEHKKIIVQPIWSIFQQNDRAPKSDNPFIKEYEIENKFVIQYSGNIGITHKVEVIVEIAERMKEHQDILFQIIGRGPRVPVLKKMVEDRGLPNCQFLPFQSDEMFPFSLAAADIGIVVLDELTAQGSVPSKSYNLMSYGIPSLYIAPPDSELHAYAVKYKHAGCFRESNLNAAKEFILSLYSDKTLYKSYQENSVIAASDFKRANADKIVEAYINTAYSS